ncbi:hypothetical protein PGTUg99_007186 [Puccinia graminis f. sp. tritici]|uniref:Hydrophobin n=1 Tax=Puccinia graminis f. sp. tritici TaxID=56615 RepID=A0A5B0R0I1_PUCGR|nr:hypothetical protein PGTUg99_007186 [Puccinia graminis f. sp. tritici]
MQLLIKSFIIISLTSAECLCAAGQCGASMPKYCGTHVTLPGHDLSVEPMNGYILKSLTAGLEASHCFSRSAGTKYCCLEPPKFTDPANNFVSDDDFKKAQCSPID